jgi:hypothetical protein
MIEVAQLVAAFKKSHLFQGFDDIQLNWLAEQFTVETFSEETTLYNTGDPAIEFLFIYKGRVNLYRKVKDQEEQTYFLVEGDFFGEVSFIPHSKHAATTKAQPETVLLKLDMKAFKRVEKKIPSLHDRFLAMAKSRQMAIQKAYTWLTKGEIIYYISRRNNFFLFQSLIIPVLIELLPLAILAYGVSAPNRAWIWTGAIFSILVAGWGLWRALDWSNDYYIITNKRVVWLEKVIGLYDSRLESMLESLLSINVNTTQLGRWFGFGDVILRTFTGEIKFSDINNPGFAEAMIREYWGRTKNASQQTQKESLRESVRNKIIAQQSVAPANSQAAAKSLVVKKTAPTGLDQPLVFEHFLKVRFTVGNTITYRKHILFLILKSIFPIFSILLALFLPGFLFALGTFSAVVMIFILLLGVGASFLWWMYNYWGWANDLYIVTEEQIVDIFRKLLGAESRRTAPLENILSVQYERAGIFGVIFNFGTVYVSVGEVQLDFEHVVDPPSVQQEIIRRMNVRIGKKKEDDAIAERERMGEWLAAYHEVSQEIREVDKRINPE